MKSFGEPFKIALHRLNENPGLDAVKHRKVCIEHDLLPTQHQDGTLDALDRNLHTPTHRYFLNNPTTTPKISASPLGLMTG